MRRFTLIFSLLVAIATTAMSQTTITDVSQLSNNKCYQITSRDSKRGAMYAKSGENFLSHCGATYNNYHNKDVAVNVEDVAQQFAFISFNGKLYLYSVSEKKFAKRFFTNTNANGREVWFAQLRKAPTDYVAVSSNNNNGYFHIKLNGEYLLNFSGGYQYGIYTNYNDDTNDDGNNLTIKEVGSFDPTEALQALNELYEVSPTSGNTYQNNTVNNTGWTSKWVTSSTVCNLTVSATENVIKKLDNPYNTYDFRCGSNSSTMTYTISVTGNHLIAGYSFKYKRQSGNTGTTTITVGGNEYNVTDEYQTLEIEEVNSGSTTFSVADGNNGIIISEFYVRLIDRFDDKLFTLESAHKTGNYLYASATNELMFGTTVNSRSVWTFAKSGDGYVMRNVHTDSYVPVLPTEEWAGSDVTFTLVPTADAGIINVTQGSNAYLLGNGVNYLHSNDGHGNKVILWKDTGIGNQYTFAEVSEFSHTLSVTDAGWSTLVLGFNATIPTNEGFKAYTINEVTAENVQLVPATGVLAANTPIIVNAPAGNYPFEYTTAEATVNTSELSGTLYDSNITEEAYILAKVGDVVGLYKAQKDVSTDTSNDSTEETTYEAFKNNANKVYLLASKVPAGEAAASNGLRFDFGDGTTTEIEKVEMRNEKEEIFDLQGRRINEITCPGIYIVNGKKVLVK